MERAQPLGDAGRAAGLAERDVTDHGLGQRRIAGVCEPRAIGADAAAERAHQLAHALAERGIADPLLAELALDILDEQLGQQRGLRAQAFVALHPHDHGGEHGGEHVEAPLLRVGHAAVGVPLRLARDRDDAAPQRHEPVPGIGLATEDFRKQ